LEDADVEPAKEKRMTRPLSLLITLGLFGFAACTRERVIVVKEPAQPVATTAAATDPNNDPQPIAKDGDKPGDDSDWGIRDRNDSVEYARVVDKVARMASDSDLQSRVQRRGMSLVNVMWEDTGRAENSALGPNISDLTLQVRRRDENGFQASLMPVIRPPNFTDKTGDVPADKFFVRVGNHSRGGELSTVPLTDVLKNLKAFASVPDSILGDGNLLAPRDTHFLVSAQAVFLPIPKTGKANFNPVLFNYQSAPRSPAVLSILVTRQGTSVSVIENESDDQTAYGGGEELYFNNKGQRAGFTAERKTDVENRIAAQGGPKTEDDKSALQKGADVLFLVQVPLVHKQIGRLGGLDSDGAADGPGGGMGMGKGMAAPAKPAAPAPASAAAGGGAMRERSDVEQAVLGHGPNLGPYNEGHRIRLVRDTHFPIRVTVQFYKATSNGVVSDIDLDSINRSIGSVYEHAEFVGSLVIPEGDPRRPTAWQKMPREWFPW
jgi:hypothetical protein